ncbi:hypothetical protein NHX12_031934 [Muraenolepis orangiensis]|uniref:Uncharacterized protein n=1 Tax=Muraenolepis orangiensis TaxID=630683 RepID=A0A9Q0E7Y6_9TELE|nr:hypothetical protein NHX12_031934 [Muraenolepis orangiensis]
MTPWRLTDRFPFVVPRGDRPAAAAAAGSEAKANQPTVLFLTCPLEPSGTEEHKRGNSSAVFAGVAFPLFTLGPWGYQGLYEAVTFTLGPWGFQGLYDAVTFTAGPWGFQGLYDAVTFTLGPWSSAATGVGVRKTSTHKTGPLYLGERYLYMNSGEPPPRRVTLGAAEHAAGHRGGVGHRVT